MEHDEKIRISGASEHNLRSVSLEFPRNRFIVVTGVSGSGKSSLIFDVLYREAESRYLGSFSSFARQFMGKLKKPAVERIEGLSPAIALDQKTVVSNPRSTVGTITGIYDALRLLFARVGKPGGEERPFTINRSLFSFNTPEGACPACKGLGVEDFLDPELLVDDDTKTLRQGALVITAPNGYIIYSQVTLDVLDQVCRAEGFHTDIPWRELTPEQKHIVLYGSDKIEIPYGKHPLESRMKWSGITAKPREMGYYKGILPVMETILQRDRNKNILRFVRSGKCRVCEGRRLNARALSVKVNGYSIADLSDMEMDDLCHSLGGMHFTGQEHAVASPVITMVTRQADMLKRLGLGHLSPGRESTTLSGGESQRLRLATLAGMDLSGMTCIFDEPSVGLHSTETGKLIEILKEIRDKGNTVIVVEHDEQFIRHADWLIDIGPGPGVHGGEVLFNGTLQEALGLPEPEILKSRTLSFLHGYEKIPVHGFHRPGNGFIQIEGATANNLKDIDVVFKLQALNVVTGVSGAGKTTLTDHVLGAYLKNHIHGGNEKAGKCRSISGWEGIGKVIPVDQAPIGRTPRSNPATYTGLFDHIRDLFSKQPDAIEKGFDKSRFSFNTAGGRCESCEGAGYQQVGMHFMGNVEVLCEACEGRRFDAATLEIRYRGKSVSDVLELTVTEASVFFSGEPKILKYLEALENLGLGYLTLGQRSSTLSGGEAQRVKLATELARPQSAHTLYLMDEPTTGLHQADIGMLLNTIGLLTGQGHTVIITEHHPAIIAAADHVIELGPGSGRDGGYLVFSGPAEEMVDCEGSPTRIALKEYRILNNEYRITNSEYRITNHEDRRSIYVKGVSTHNLQHIDVEIPHNMVTVITGVSGSGKSSLAFDTIHAEGQNRFLESFSPYVRSRIGIRERADFEEISGLTPTFAVDQRGTMRNPRSTVGTMTGIYDHYRLLFSRSAHNSQGSYNPGILSSLFSFNHQHGACPACDGLGQQTTCDPEKLVTHPDRSLAGGAMDGTKTGKFYGDPYGQYVATLLAAGAKHNLDFNLSWNELPAPAREVALFGTGAEVYDVTWQFKRDERTGEHHFTGPWKGFANLVNDEYQRKHADQRGEGMLALMQTLPCPSCNGSRLCPEALSYVIMGKSIAEISGLSVVDSVTFFRSFLAQVTNPVEKETAVPLVGEILRKLDFLAGLGLSYMTIDRISSTLSGGEAQRIRLAAQLGSGLTGITYILDEPTIGLHPRDTGNLMKLVRALQETGNTVVIVEHDRDVILAADHVIEIGPGAGKSGGRVVAQGTPAEIILNRDSITGPYLSEQYDIRMNRKYQHPGAHHETLSGAGSPQLSIHNASTNNLKGFDLQIPIGGITAITGVSGSGKSTLLFGVILASWEHKKPVGCSSIRGFEHFKRLVSVHQRTGFNSSLATPATFTGIFELVRDLFAALPEARSAGYGKNHFSYLNKAGNCPVCEGTGQITISMDFLSDVKMECEQCQGRRYRPEILLCRYKGLHIANILEMTVSEACIFFADRENLHKRLQVLEKTGLGYLQLGQPLDTISGGESQRLTLAAELMKPGQGPVLYMFEEPSTGLHFRDIEYLLDLFHQLAGQGNTLFIIEHDPAVIAHADHIVELGPEGGDKGGYLVTSSSR